MLAYASDFTLLDTALIAHGRFVFDPRLMLASLDHAIWFHRPVRFDDWHLYHQELVAISGHRGLTRGAIYEARRNLVATVIQEVLVRPAKVRER